MRHLRELVRWLGRRELALIVLAGFISALATEAVEAAPEAAIWAFNALT
ncbi:hypothetical protein [Streptomyces sp. Ncost-T6T-1]|nr:hypothetical protein [Streptomyces sp. Ncost-T6T-1]